MQPLLGLFGATFVAMGLAWAVPNYISQAQETQTVEQAPPSEPTHMPPEFSKENGEGNGEFSKPQQTVSPEELRGFRQEMRDLQNQARQLLKQLNKAQGPSIAEWKQAVQEVLSAASACASKIAQTSSPEDQRSIMDDCRQQNLWQVTSDIQQEFVPPEELNNAYREIKRQTQDLARLKKQLAKLGGGTGAVDTLVAQLEGYKTAIQSVTGQDQREALREYWDARLWEEVDKIRTAVELPRQIKDAGRDMKSLQKSATGKTFVRAYEFFGIQPSYVQDLVTGKQRALEQISAHLAQGNFDDARSLMEEEIYQGWHPGDLRHFLDMIRGSYDQLRRVKDQEFKSQILEILAPILESFQNGEIREARDAMVQFNDQIQRSSYLLNPRYDREGGIDDRTQKALERLQSLIEGKMQKEGGSVPEEKPIQKIPF